MPSIEELCAALKEYTEKKEPGSNAFMYPFVVLSPTGSGVLYSMSGEILYRFKDGEDLLNALNMLIA